MCGWGLPQGIVQVQNTSTIALFYWMMLGWTFQQLLNVPKGQFQNKNWIFYWAVQLESVTADTGA